jgi:thymidylate kinase
MDSPRVGQMPGRYLYNLFGKWEKKLYEAMPIPDGIYNLKIPFELALERNRARVKGNKETDAQMRKRYTNYSDLQYRAVTMKL